VGIILVFPLTQFRQEPFDFFAHASQILERTLSGGDRGHQIVAVRCASARDLGGKIAGRGGACLTDGYGLRMRLQDF